MSESGRRPPEDGGSSEDNLLILPDGTRLGIFELMRRERESGERSMSTSFLRGGDVVAMQSDSGKGDLDRYLFRVQGASWQDLGIGGGTPSKILTGELSGKKLPAQMARSKVQFAGSSFGGRNIQRGTLITGRLPCFGIIDSNSENSEIYLPEINDFRLIRQDKNGIAKIFDVGSLEVESKKENPNHEQRLVEIEELIKLFGFKGASFRDCGPSTDTSIKKTVKNGRYYAAYQVGQGTGNQLGIFDNTNGQWVGAHYFNSKGEDILKIGFADVIGAKEVGDIERVPTQTNRIYATGRAVATYVSSSALDFRAVNYHPSEAVAEEILGIPKLEAWPSYVDVAFLSDGTTAIDRSSIMRFNPVEGAELAGRIKGLVTLETSSEGGAAVHVGSFQDRLKDPKVELPKIINYLKKGVLGRVFTRKKT